LLPETVDFNPTGDGRSPLARAADWMNTACPTCGGPAQRETDTMDGFACSSWYFLRFASPHEEERPFDPAAVCDWLPVDTYVGGAEHAVMHLLYARFWTKVIYDAGLIDFVEPFSELRNQGVLHSAVDGQRMSKSKGNVVTPDEVVAEWGVDALRAYILFLGPFDASVVWDERGIVGVARFLERYWRLAHDIAKETGDRRLEIGRLGDWEIERPAAGRQLPADETLERMRHKMIKRITREMEQFRFNTAVAGLMEYLNGLIAVREAGQGTTEQWRDTIATFTLLLAPISPFITEEIWQRLLGRSDSVHRQPWPNYDESLVTDEQVTIVVQVNGKVRDRMEVAADSDDETLRQIALNSAGVQRHVNGREIREIIVVPRKLVNIVTD
jgi:leucyl-tRNA synthetase